MPDEPVNSVAQRNLADFGKLSPAENALLKYCQTGAIAAVAEVRPTKLTARNRVRASFLRFLVLGGDASITLHELGIQIEGAWISGLLNLEAVTARSEMYFEKCVFEQIDAQRSKLKYLALASCRIQGSFNGQDLKCDGGLLLRDSIFDGPVDLDRAWIQGAMDCSGSQFLSREAHSLSFDGARITSLVLLRDGFIARGGVRFIRALIEGPLEADGGHLQGLGGVAIRGDGVSIGGSLRLGAGFIAEGDVRLLNAKIGGNVECGGGTFRNAGGNALTCDGAVIAGSFHFSKEAEAQGAVRLLGARVGNDLDFCGASISNGEGYALLCDALSARSVILRDGFSATGEVRFIRAELKESLDCSGAVLRNDAGDALLCDGARVEGDILLRHGFRCRGAVRLTGSTIKGNLSCIDCILENPGEIALSCDGVEISGTLFFRTAVRVEGGIDLSASHARNLCDDVESWDSVTGTLSLDGFTYGRLVGAAPTDAGARVAWLARQGVNDLNREFRPQPWEQLIAVLRAMGHFDEARLVAMAKQRRLREAGKIRSSARFFHWLYGALIGYGYRPVRLLGIVIMVWLLSASAYWAAVNPSWFGSTSHLIAPTDKGPEVPCPAPVARGAPCPARSENYSSFVPLIYSLDVLMPVVDFGHKESWQPVVNDSTGKPLFWGRAIRSLYWFELAFGWMAGVLLIGVLGNLIKKD